MYNIKVVLLLLPAFFALGMANDALQDASTPLATCAYQGDQERVFNATLANGTQRLLIETRF